MTMTDHSPPKPKRPALRHTLAGAAALLVPIRPGTVTAALRNAPRGDGHAVIVVPPFFSSDGHTASLRRFLTGCGYEAQGWDQGINVGPTAAALAGIESLLAVVHRQSGRKVTLIGHSLGGVIARELTKQHPDQVRQLVLLASPIHLPTASPLEPVYRLLSRWHREDAVGSIEQMNRAAAGAGDRALHAQRRYRRVAKLPRDRRRSSRKHRSARRAWHDGAQPRRLAHHRRPPGAAGRHVAALSGALNSSSRTQRRNRQDAKAPRDV